MATAVPCASAGPRPDFTARQRQVLELLRLDLSDETIARTLGVSVRTVRYEVAAVMDVLHVHSRFAAGCAYAECDRATAGRQGRS